MMLNKIKTAISRRRFIPANLQFSMAVYTKVSKMITVNQAKGPNIIFILVDDLGYADVGFNGSTFYETSAIDALAKDGLVFDHAYMYPTCSPSRTALATGKNSHRTGVYTVPALEPYDLMNDPKEEHNLASEHPNIARRLEEQLVSWRKENEVPLPLESTLAH